MRLKGLFTRHRFRVVATMRGDTCPALRFVTMEDKQYGASRKGLLVLLERAAQEGLSVFPPQLLHQADSQNGIYEFIKGDLRLLFFKGFAGELVVCTDGYVKKDQKADAQEVAKAVRLKREYDAAKRAGTIQIEE